MTNVPETFVLWQVMQAVLNPQRGGQGKIKRAAARIQHLWNATVHCVLVGIASWQLLGYCSLIW